MHIANKQQVKHTERSKVSSTFVLCTVLVHWLEWKAHDTHSIGVPATRLHAMYEDNRVVISDSYYV